MSLPLSNTLVTRLDNIMHTKIVVLLCDDHRIYFVDLSRNNSVICALAHKSKVGSAHRRSSQTSPSTAART